ncbi:tyrosine-protein phosphatase [Pseudomaricurvus sp. HS19]|uniref:tyrosine-protein phosphatase n=1 Tax=Pseudomaricurvus sp. HS19 TaxID=2692626 RepID=UPI00136C81D8|nr:tyrosine-protein phosphatase [Pseudomaricurvus sp. HS19]MYM61827.1 hypothetical protein [Pseudomaricurvus sp. HS19]
MSVLSPGERSIALQGAKNFRDFGGYRSNVGGCVRTGKLFRAAALSELTEADLAMLVPLGIRAVCDLRRDIERDRAPTRWYQGSEVRFYHLPFFRDKSSTAGVMSGAREGGSAEVSRQIMIDMYRRMGTRPQVQQQMQQIFSLLRAGETPLLIHCSGGKDRTGVACALILALLGVEQETIVEDYMLSLAFYTGRTDVTRQARGQLVDSDQAGAREAEALLPLYTVDPDYLRATFAGIIEAYGSMEGYYVTGLGLGQGDIERLRQQLLA